MNDQQKLQVNRLNIYDENKEMIQERLEEEKRHILNEESYWIWLEKKTKEIEQVKLMEEEEEINKKEIEYFEKKIQTIKDLKFNEWLAKKQIESKIKQQEKNIEKKNEMKKFKKEQAEKVWKAWLERKEKLIQEDKLRKKIEMQKKEQQRKEKQVLSEQKYNEWVKNASTRPKPVRSNLGLTSLSCTNISYINPEPWKNVLDENDVDLNEFEKT
ncbi:uncharacterized protein LOC142333962 [Lycorma delicatula]|uniref:uncharacterized protein LOC142333962 n=1 Tax=Lycorma delicatula TaxID=130591 RepID=UPI003F50FB83